MFMGCIGMIIRCLCDVCGMILRCFWDGQSCYFEHVLMSVNCKISFRFDIFSFLIDRLGHHALIRAAVQRAVLYNSAP